VFEGGSLNISTYATPPELAGVSITFWTLIRDVLGYPDSGFFIIFPQALQENTRIIPRMGHYHSQILSNSSFILPFDAL
jgi:hypothetical protein